METWPNNGMGNTYPNGSTGSCASCHVDPGYRGPTCATCHMSGIGEPPVTHNVSERLYCNLWAKGSKVRGSDDVLSPLLGDGPAGRKK